MVMEAMRGSQTGREREQSGFLLEKSRHLVQLLQLAASLRAEHHSPSASHQCQNPHREAMTEQQLGRHAEAVWCTSHISAGLHMCTATSSSPARDSPCQGPRLSHHSVPASYKGLDTGQIFIKQLLKAGTITIGSHLLPLAPQTHSGNCMYISFRGQSGCF